MTIASTGSLKGSGSIDSGIIINGTHSPGNSIGTQSITGNVTYNSGSVIEIELDNDGNHDQINITGDLTINNGATFKGVSFGGAVSNSLILDIMTYTGELTVGGGVVTDERFAFDTSYLDTAVLDFTLSHSTTDDTIYMIVNPSEFNPLSVSSFTDGLTLALDNINSAGASGEMASLIIQLQSILAESELHQAFTELSPVQLNATPAAIVAATQSIGDVISGHIDKVTAGVTNQRLASEKVASKNSGVLLNVDQSLVIEQKKWTPFIEFVVSKGDQDDKDGISGYKLDNTGFIIGTDYLVSDKFLVGLSGSYMQPSMDSNDDLVSIDIETWQANVYSSYFLQNFYIDANAGYGWSKIDSERQINFMGTAAEADHDAEYFALGVGAGYRLDVYKKVIVEPFCELNYVDMDEDGYEESGAGGANSKISSNSVESLKSGLGIRLAKLFDLQNGISIKPEISYRWEHEFKDDAVSNSASFVSAGSSFTTEGIKPDANHHIFGASIKAFMGHQMSLYLNYEYDRSDSYRSHNGLAGIEINF
nr:autotransporter outer membrane beta-barrel domain-containing protein [Desulfobacter hydrogenophilus]